MNKLLMICCTKGRPERVAKMIKSFKSTKVLPGTDIVFCLDTEDERLKEYDKIMKDKYVIMGHPNYYTPMANDIVKNRLTNYDFYGLVDDDFIFRTKGWDEMMTNTVIEKGNGWGMAYANDLWPESSIGHEHPCIPVTSKKTIDCLDYWIWPGLNHFKIDTYMKDLLKPLSLMFFCEDVVIEHMHVNNNKAERDANYKWAYSTQEQAHGTLQHAKWKFEKMAGDHLVILKNIQLELKRNAQDSKTYNEVLRIGKELGLNIEGELYEQERDKTVGGCGHPRNQL